MEAETGKRGRYNGILILAFNEIPNQVRHWSSVHDAFSGFRVKLTHSGNLNTDGTPGETLGVSAIHGISIESASSAARDPRKANRVPSCTLALSWAFKPGKP